MRNPENKVVRADLRDNTHETGAVQGEHIKATRSHAVSDRCGVTQGPAVTSHTNLLEINTCLSPGVCPRCGRERMRRQDEEATCTKSSKPHEGLSPLHLLVVLSIMAFVDTILPYLQKKKNRKDLISPICIKFYNSF